MKTFRFFAAVMACILLLNCVPAFAAVQNANPFGLKRAENDPEEFYEFYLQEGGFCLSLNTEVLTKAIDTLPKLKVDEGLSIEKANARKLIKMERYNNFEKHIYELRPGELRYDGIVYTLTQKQYDTLLAAVDKSAEKLNNQVGIGNVFYLVWMNPNRVTSISFTDKTEKKAVSTTIKKDELYHIANRLSWISIKKDYTRYDPAKEKIAEKSGGVYTILQFDNSGIAYRMFMDSENLYIEYTDGTQTDKGYKYALECEDELKTLRVTAGIAGPEEASPLDPAFAPTTGKPVIYLYPEKPADVTVKLDFKGELMTTIPAYNGGWSVTATPDGTITNKADGAKYPYLFWDGTSTFKDWDFSSGYCVAKKNIGAFLAEKLAALGLNGYEAAEFIAYWRPLLEKNPYTLITFATAQYEAIAPLAIHPAPETVIRAHMVYKGLDAPVVIPAQTLDAPPPRTGFTVVEWGGTRAD